MSKNAKIISGIVIAAVVLIGGAMALHREENGPGWGMKGQGAAMTDSGALPSGNDTSDQAIDQDMQSINANLDASAQDSSQVDQGVNDASSAQ